MRIKALTILLVVTIVVAVAAIALSLGGAGSRPEARSGEIVLSGLAQHLGDVATLKVSGAGGTVTLQREGSADAPSWGVGEKGGYPADTAKVAGVLLGFAELKLVEPKTAKADAYKRLDVEEPGQEGGHSRLVNLTDAKGGKLGELIVGKRRPDRLGTGADGLYIRRPGDAQSWLAQGNVDLPSELKEWLDRKVPDLPAKRVKQVTLTHEDGSALVLKRDKEDGKFAAEGAPEDARYKSDALLNEPAGALEGLELSDVKPAADQPFPEKGVARAEWQTFDGLTVTAETYKDGDANWLHLKAAGEGDAASKEAASLNAKWANWAWSIFEYKANAMKTKLADLIEAPKGS